MFFFALGDPSINDAGDVAFSGLANGPSARTGLQIREIAVAI